MIKTLTREEVKEILKEAGHDFVTPLLEKVEGDKFCLLDSDTNEHEYGELVDHHFIGEPYIIVDKDEDFFEYTLSIPLKTGKYTGFLYRIHGDADCGLPIDYCLVTEKGYLEALL